MAPVAPFTLYTTQGCPFAQRARIALLETGLLHDTVEIDLQNKPAWYQVNINPASKVPAVVYGVKQDDKSVAPPGSVKLAESLVLVEFFADLAPESHLLPADPVHRAKARFFVSLVSDKFGPLYNGWTLRGEGEEALLSSIRQLADELDDAGPYLLGEEWSIADTAIAPFLGRLYLSAKHDIGNWVPGDGPRFLQKAASIPKWERYASAVLARQSFRETFPEDFLHMILKRRYDAQRK